MFTKVPEAKIVQYLRLLFRYRASNADIRSPILTRTIAPYYNRRCSNFFPSPSSALSSSSSFRALIFPPDFRASITFSTTFNIKHRDDIRRKLLFPPIKKVEKVKWFERFELLSRRIITFQILDCSKHISLKEKLSFHAFPSDRPGQRTQYPEIGTANNYHPRDSVVERSSLAPFHASPTFTRRICRRWAGNRSLECLHSSRAPSIQGWDILPTGLWNLGGRAAAIRWNRGDEISFRRGS